jgi:glycosyltransferase involved in cell wall biosynthesis
MIPIEGIEDLVKAMPLIVAQIPSAHLMLAGEGPLLETVRMIQRRMPDPGRVHIIGAVPLADVRGYYSLFDLVVYPRRSTPNTETVTPLKPLEAMAMEKAVLVANVGGLLELVDDAVGATFRVGDVEHLAQQCVALLADPGRRAELGRAARQRVIETRSWSHLAGVYREAYSAAGAVDESLEAKGKRQEANAKG